MSISTPEGRIPEPETESASAPHMESSHESVQEEQPYFVKGKRTKRYRLQARIPITVSSKTIVATDFSPKSDETSISSDIYDNKQEPNTTNNKGSIMVKAKNTTNDIGQPASSSEEHNRHHHSTTITVENQDDEDMANCLILLAQGQSKRVSQIPPPRIIGQKRTDYDNIYECKTCGKRFPSFQALGGHRASHKKPKKEDQFNVEIKPHEHYQYNANNLCFLSDDENSPKIKTYPTLSLQIINNHNDHHRQFSNKSRIHECSICGAEFSSGQALGGHMRRHRSAIGMPISLPATKALSLIPLTVFPPSDYDHHDRYFPDHDDPDPSSGLSLDLDLNLPAVSADEHRESQFQCASKQQQQQPQTQPLVFSSPALVGCHQ